MSEGNEPSSEFPWVGAIADLHKLKQEVEQGFQHFWQQDQIIGFDKDGKRIGTGIPRIKSKKNYRIFNYSSRSKAFPISKSEESRQRADG